MKSFKTSVYLFLFLFISCGANKSPSKVNGVQTEQQIQTLLVTPQRVVFHVYYETGADPYADNNKKGKPIWNLFVDNVNKIYDYRSAKPALTIPTTLAQMTPLSITTQPSWSAEELVNLAASIKDFGNVAGEGHFQIIFLKGYYEGNQSIIGVNITGTPVIALFKDVIRVMGNKTDDWTAKYAEQSSLIHEFGHAVGLVNNGIPLSSAHMDADHGAHCTNPQCVMYWSNEGTNDLIEYVKKLISTGNDIMFDSACLQDVDQLI